MRDPKCLQCLHSNLLFEFYLPSLLRKKALWVWAVLSMVCLATSAILSLPSAILSLPTVSHDGLLLFPFSISVYFVPLAVRFCLDRVINWHSYVSAFFKKSTSWGRDVEQFFVDELTEIVQSHKFVLCGGIILAALSVLIHFNLDILPNQRPRAVLYFGQLMIIVSAFLAGAALGYLLLLARFVWQLGKKYSVCVEPHTFGILRIGSSLAQCCVCSIVLWALYTFTVSWQIQEERLQKELWMILLVLSLPPLAIIIGTFVSSQYQLHLKMVEYKRETLHKLDKERRTLMSVSIEEFTDLRIAKITFLNSHINRTNTLPEWPFRWQTLITVTSSIIIPILSPFTKDISEFLGSLFRAC